jgi:cytochrome c biogenesis protein CcmG, thiol:disulfide interchange protein DsbE
MTKSLIALGALASLATAACDPPLSRSTVVPTVNVALDTAATQQPSAPPPPSSEPPSAPSNLPPCERDASGLTTRSLICSKAPELRLERVTGTGPGSLAAARGQVVILAFCATFAAPCSRSLPVYQGIAKEHPGRVTLIVLLVDEPDDLGGRGAIKEYASNVQIDVPVLWDTKHKAAEAYSLQTIPTTVIVDPAGVVRSIYAGYRDGEAEAIRAEIKDLL